MTRLACIAWTALFLVACSSSVAKPGACPRPAIPTFENLEHGAALGKQINAALTALGDPGSSTSHLMELGFEDPERSGQWPPDRARKCLGVVRWTDEGKFIGILLGELRTDGSVGPETFLTIASYSSGQWRFSWPAGLGPPVITASMEAYSSGNLKMQARQRSR